MSFNTHFHQAVAWYMTEDLGYDRVRDVVSVKEENNVRYGNCETCSYEELVLIVEYIDLDGDRCFTTLYESFSELLRSLTSD